ncbi:MAG: hypothetical protein J5X22_17085 [Candidatus Accumulibacter sp.]|uniref:hypothetical protein n=1 Tax=Accumulibacter sp. TaxID=2053492 RepID=UPI001ACBD360|nr:hypothetical protein [Accumulibacter sp.]MBN8519994.1 hypothetical protein [Accumulibacter sp.]MBO3712135.1 hypothetical protein [Accumulibacter sp.]
MAKVTRLPHDGRMIMGGKGCIIPFKLEPTNPAEKTTGETPDAASSTPDDSTPAGARDEALRFGALAGVQAICWALQEIP